MKRREFLKMIARTVAAAVLPVPMLIKSKTILPGITDIETARKIAAEKIVAEVYKIYIGGKAICFANPIKLKDGDFIQFGKEKYNVFAADFEEYEISQDVFSNKGIKSLGTPK